MAGPIISALLKPHPKAPAPKNGGGTELERATYAPRRQGGIGTYTNETGIAGGGATAPPPPPSGGLVPARFVLHRVAVSRIIGVYAEYAARVKGDSENAFSKVHRAQEL